MGVVLVVVVVVVVVVAVVAVARVCAGVCSESVSGVRRQAHSAQ